MGAGGGAEIWTQIQSISKDWIVIGISSPWQVSIFKSTLKSKVYVLHAKFKFFEGWAGGGAELGLKSPRPPRSPTFIQE